MALTLVPFVVLFIAIVAIFHFPIGRDLHVPIFLMPWYALEPDVGVGITLTQFTLAALAFKYALRMRLDLRTMPGLGIVIAIVAVGLASAAITFATHTADTEFAGGELRNGVFRAVVVLGVFALAVLPFVLVGAPGVRLSRWGLLRTYVVSVGILCVLGVVQLAVFNIAGTDIFPIGIFQHQTRGTGPGDTGFVSATFMLGHVSQLRISSLAGDPKSLGMVTAAAAVVVMAFRSKLFRRRAMANMTLMLFLFVIAFTHSTSALLSLAVCLPVCLGLWFLGRPLRRTTVLLIYSAAAATILSTYLYNVAAAPLTPYAAPPLPIDNYADLFYARTLGRLEVEDFDWVLLKSFLMDPAALPLGRGFGLGHLFTDPYIPEEFRYYMEGRVISPKSGVTLFLVNTGLIGLGLFVLFLAKATPSISSQPAQHSSAAKEYIRRAQMVLIPLVLMMYLRAYIFEITLMITAILSAGVLQERPLGRQNALPLSPRLAQRPSPVADERLR